MIWHITKKEIHNNIITSRFIVGTVLILILVVIITWLQIDQYAMKLDAYNYSIQNNEEQLGNAYVYSEITSVAVKPPEIMSIFSIGTIGNLGGFVEIKRQEVPYEATPYIMDNPLLKVFQSIDIVLVFKLILSLLTLLFAFDLFCGEKEAGTLKLMLTGNISRAELYAGKIFGGLLILCLSLMLASVMGMLIIIISPKIILTGEVLARLLLIVLYTVIYFSAFYFIGALVSALTHKSSSSLVICLFIWAFLVVGLPNLANFTAERLKPIESIKGINQKVADLWGEFNEELNEYYENNPRSMGSQCVNGSTIETDGYYKTQCAHVDLFRYYRHFIPFSENLRFEYVDRMYQVRRNHIDILKKQADFVSMSSILSPVRLYENLTSIAACTDMDSHLDFLDQSRMYRIQMIDYFQLRNAFNIPRFFSIMTEEEAPDIDVVKLFEGGTEDERIWNESSLEYDEEHLLSLEDFPRFSYQPVTLRTSFQKALPSLCILILLNLIFIALGYFAFAGYDVR